MLEKIFVLSTILTLLLSPLVIAPSHPVYIDSETGQVIDEILGDPGTTPDSFWYGFERWWEDIQVANTKTPEEKAALLENLMQERYAEFHTMIEEGNYEVAEETLSEIREMEEEFTEVVENTAATGDNLGFIHELEAAAFEQEDIREMLEQNLDNIVAVGGLSMEQAERLTRTLDQGINGVQAAVDVQEEEITEAIAEEQGITHLEAEFQVAAAEEEAGLTDDYQEEVGEGLGEVQRQLEQVEQDLVQAIEEGREVPPEATELLAQAQAELDQSQGYYIDEQFGRSFDHLIAVNALIADAYGFISGELPGENLILSLEDRQQRVTEENNLYINEYEQHREEWVTQFPEYASEFDRWYEQSKNTLELTTALEGALAEQVAHLEAKGMDGGQIFNALGDILSAEYERVYGDTYVPPVFLLEPIPIEVMGTLEVTDLASLPPDALETTGGFVEGYSYTDPVTGYVYEFTEEGYTYTTTLGLVYEEQYPERFSLPTAYEQGNEEHSYTVETPEGPVTYNYYATGYDVTLPDGTTETHAYPEGRYDIAGGGLFEHTATGFDFRHEGEVNHYEYNPVYDTFVGETGEVYRPPEGVYFQDEGFEYNYEDHVFQYGGEEGVWAYNPVTNVWTSPTGETHSPDSYAVAPVGHEGDTREYGTVTGEVWTWDEATSTWSNAGGDRFDPETNEWESGIGRTYEFDHSTGQFLDPETREVARDIIWSGVTWNFDSVTNSWTSTTGDVYSGPGGLATPPGGGGFHEEYELNDWAYDESIGTWSSPGWNYDASTGEWTSPEGNSFYDPDGNPTGWYAEDGSFQHWDEAAWSGGEIDTSDEGDSYSGGGGYDSSGNYVGGEYGNYDASGTYTGGAQYGEPQPFEGTSTGGYTGGSYSGGGYTGGSYSGGGGYDSAGNYVGGDYGGYDASGTYTGGAQYGGESQGGGGSYGGDGGGSTGGSYGGDSGGSTGGGGGGGDGGGGAPSGGVISEPSASEEEHPLTSWIYKYLGIRI